MFKLAKTISISIENLQRLKPITISIPRLTFLIHLHSATIFVPLTLMLNHLSAYTILI